VKALWNALLGLFVCFMVPVMLVGMLTGDHYLQVLGGLVGIGFYVFVRINEAKKE
jgi:L-lactate permease